MKPAEPILGAAFAEHLAATAGGDRPTADDTLCRGSDAYSCGRRIAFGALKVPKDIPWSPDTLAAFDAGKHHHTRLQALLVAKFGAQVEVECSYKAQGIEVSGHADAHYDDTLVEIKSMRSYPFLRAAGGRDIFGRDVAPEGPKIEHLIQAGIYANAPQIKAEVVHIIYLNKEDSRIAEWLIKMDAFYDIPGSQGTSLREAVVEELERLNRIADDIRHRILPWRSIPGHGVVKSPPVPDSKDEPWNCRYCPWQPTCARLPASKTGLGAVDRLDDEEPF